MLIVKRHDWLEERIEEEKDDVKTYFDKFLETGDPDYKTLSEQEMEHARILEKKYEHHDRTE